MADQAEPSGAAGPGLSGQADAGPRAQEPQPPGADRAAQADPRQAGGDMLGDPRFFRRAGPFTLAQVAEATGAAMTGGLPGTGMTGVAPLQLAGPGCVSFFHNRKYLAQLGQTRAGAVLVTAEHAPRLPAGTAALIVADPQVGWARAAGLFHPAEQSRPGVHPAAVVDPAAIVDPSAEIGPLAVIGAAAVIGPHCCIGAGAVIGAGVVMGASCRIGPLASITHAILGDRVYIYPGARIGQEGFGFAITSTGFLTVPQLGRVILEDDVEIGANSTVDRGGALDTVIGAGTRLDNLVHVGHNSRLGRACVLAGQSGMAGSTVLDDFVQVGAQAGMAGHLRIGTKARIGPQAGIMSDVDPGAEVIGSPAMPVREFFRNVATLRRLARKPAA